LPNTEIFQSKDVASVQQMRQNKKKTYCTTYKVLMVAACSMLKADGCRRNSPWPAQSAKSPVQLQLPRENKIYIKSVQDKPVQ
jgi:hypothetical protein